MIPDTPRGDPGAGMNVASLLAHEMFHRWNGHTIMAVDPEAVLLVPEGFTDFAGVCCTATAADRLCRAREQEVADLWTSEIRNAPNERIQADLKSDGVKRLPYLRGDVVA